LIIESIPVKQNTKHVVITGGCGYIGSHIAKALHKQGGYTVTVIDWVQRDNALRYADHYVNADFDSDTTYNYLKLYPADAIVHCAGYLLVGESVVDPAAYYVNNVAKTANFLNKLRSAKTLPVFVFSSSAAVYGNPESIPVAESNRIQPVSPYGHSKAMTEQMLTDFDHAYGLKSACLRYFNACGADPHDGDLGQQSGASHITARLLDAQLLHQQFILNGTDFNTPDGTCIRDYVHVWDLATAHVLAIEYLLTHKTSLILNLGTNIGISNREVIQQVNAIAGNVNVLEAGRRAGDPDKLIADAGLARKILNWQPQYSTLAMIVDTAWKWYQKRE